MAFNRTDRAAERRAQELLRADGLVRLVYIGENPDNISGKSNKFYEISLDKLATQRGGSPVYQARWGRVGTHGQSMHLGVLHAAVAKLESKMRRGYDLAADMGETPAPTSTPAMPLPERIAAATFAAVTPTRWVSHAAGKGLIELTQVDVGGHDYKLYTDLDGKRLYVLTRGPDGGLKHAALGAR